MKSTNESMSADTTAKNVLNGIKKTNGRTEKKTSAVRATNGQKKVVEKKLDMTARLKELETELAKAQSDAKESFEQADNSKREIERLQKENRLKRPISIQEAISKVLETKAVTDKLEFLQETRKKLAGFSFSNSGMTSSIELKDGSGKSFKSTNSGTVQLVIDTMKIELDKHIGKAEKELLDII